MNVVNDYGILAERHDQLGNHKQAAELVLKFEHPDYDWVVKQLELAQDYEEAAKVCLRAGADSWGSAVRHKEYSFPAFELFLKAKKFDQALDVCCKQLSEWTGGADRIHSVYVAQGIKGKKAWKSAAETIVKRAHPYSQLAYEASHAYEKAGLPKKAGDHMLKRRPSDYCYPAFDLFVASGMTKVRAAQRVLRFKNRLYPWQVGEFCQMAEKWADAITAFEQQKKDQIVGQSELIAKLAPLYEKVKRWHDAADSYEQIGDTSKAIECRKKENADELK
jgi:tetratricopeptide (TPR) repeat protein